MAEQETSQRQEFEKWAVSSRLRLNIEHSGDGRYWSSDTEAAWEAAKHFFEAGERQERERCAKYASAEANYWNEHDGGDISIGGIAAASNICSEILAPGKAIGRKYDPVTNTITDDPHANRPAD